MPAFKNATPIRVRDDRGHEVYLVPITNVPNAHAILEIADYERLCKTHTGTINEYAGACHMFRKGSKLGERVARLIVNAPSASIVRHFNRDRRDFRNGNLVVVPRKTRRKPKERSDKPLNSHRDYLAIFTPIP